jgi:hypothetical protein
MTLKEKFKQWLDTDPRLQIREVPLEVIADEFAIEFAEWLGKYGNTRLNNGNWMINHELKALTSKEVLERFKKEKGL